MSILTPLSPSSTNNKSHNQYPHLSTGQKFKVYSIIKNNNENICFKNNKVTKYGKNLTENGHLLTQKTSTPSSEWISDNNDDMIAHVFE